MGTATAVAERGEVELAEDRVEKIRSLFDKIDEAEHLTDEVRWTAAELVAAEVEGGKSCRALGEELDRSAMYVSRYNRAWKRFQEDPSIRDESFTRAYAPPRGVTQVTPKHDEWTADGNAYKIGALLASFEPGDHTAEQLRALLVEAEVLVENLRLWIEAAEEEEEEEEAAA